MFLLFLKKYWLEALEVTLIICLFGYVEYLRYDIKDLLKDKQVLQSDLNASRAYINAQNIVILQNKSDYDEAIKKLPTVLKSIDTRYKTEVITVEKWRESNATDCNTSIQYLNTFQF